MKMDRIHGGRHQCVIRDREIFDDDGEFIRKEIDYELPKIIDSDIGWQLQTGWRGTPIMISSVSDVFQSYLPTMELIKDLKR